MEILYTIKKHKVFYETIGNDAEHNYKGFEFKNICVYNKMMNVYFCQNEKYMFVIAGILRKAPARRGADHRWHSGTLYLDVYFRKNFRTKEEGNAFYKMVKTRKEIK